VANKKSFLEVQIKINESFVTMFKSINKRLTKLEKKGKKHVTK